MARVIVVDNNPDRRRGLKDLLSGFEQSFSVADYARIEDETRANELEEGSLLLLHVGKAQNEHVLQALNGRYKDTFVICYSGGVEVAKEYIDHQSQIANHCWYGKIIENRVSEIIKKDLKNFFEAFISGKDDNLCHKLNAIDAVLESKLEVLSLIAKRVPWDDIKDSEEYETLFNLQLINRKDYVSAVNSYAELQLLRSRLFPE